LGLTLSTITLGGVAATGSLRLDPHHYLLFDEVAAVAGGIEDAVPIKPPFVRAVANGENLSEEAYEIGGADLSEYLYVSVGALSQFALRQERCVPLKPPEDYPYKWDIADMVCGPSEILISRSGTPGIAWPCLMFDGEERQLLPSGFVIRVDLAGSGLEPLYAAAVLNHPIWRIWSASLAGGKRQRNLSQENLGELLIPRLSDATQARIGDAYRNALGEIGVMLADGERLRGHCDAVLGDYLSEDIVSLSFDDLRVDDVTLSRCAVSGNLRLDARYHRGDVRRPLLALERAPFTRLGDLLSERPIKRGQPTILSFDGPGIAERVVATVSLQNGLIAWELTKPTDTEEIDKSASKVIRRGDVLMAMDGEGSIGKAAAFHGDAIAVTDSHVALLRTGDEVLADALSCFINSSLGQAQVAIATTGATGQTQLSADDVCAFLVPADLLSHARDIARSYGAVLTKYEALVRRVRRRLCEVAAETNAAIVAEAELAQSAREALARIGGAAEMLEVLDRLTPEMF
jgi:hypothetical protein